MKIRLLDTNVCIRHLRGSTDRIALKLTEFPLETIKLCEIVAAELYYGCHKSNDLARNLVLTNNFLDQFECLMFDLRAAEIFGKIRTKLEAIGMRIGPYDLQIAAIALANDAILVTGNVREFSRVEGLRIENWEHGV